jgi:hypothetical protein
MINGKTLTVLSIGWGDQLEDAKSVVFYSASIFPFFDDALVVDHLNNLVDYNRFVVEDLCDFVNTDYVLMTQPDGFIINPKAWKDEFLNFDYIGAPWPWHGVCGNGGFCIRSKKFLEVSSKLNYIPDHPEYQCCPEDSFLCHPNYNRSFMIENGIKFADMKTALEFSFEHPIPLYPEHTIKHSFGFHGKHNL